MLFRSDRVVHTLRRHGHTDDKRLRASGLYRDWAPSIRPIWEINNADGQTLKVFQVSGNTVYLDIRPGTIVWYAFNRPLHEKSPETARPFVRGQSSHDV